MESRGSVVQVKTSKQFLAVHFTRVGDFVDGGSSDLGHVAERGEDDEAGQHAGQHVPRTDDQGVSGQK